MRMLTISDSLEDDDSIMGIGVSSRKVLGIKDNVITLVQYHGINGEITNNQKLTLTVKHSKYVEDDNNSFGLVKEPGLSFVEKSVVTKKAVKGDFEIVVSWNFAYEDTGKSYMVNKKLDINGVNDNILKAVDVSPISIWITVDGDDVLGALTPIVKFTDGTQLQYSNRTNPENTHAMFANNQIGDNSRGISTLGYVFDEIKDIKTIVSITIGDQIIYVK